MYELEGTQFTDSLFVEKSEFTFYGARIKLYECGGFDLYDPKDIIISCGQRRNDIIQAIDNINLFRVNTLTNLGITNEKILVNEIGLYDILFVIDNPKAKKFRRNFFIHLNQYRRNLNLGVEEFVKYMESKEDYTDIPCYIDNSFKLHPFITEIKGNLDIRKLYILDSKSFPVFNGIPVNIETNYDDYIKNIDKTTVEHNIDFMLGYEYVIKALSKVLNVSEKLVVEDLLKANLTRCTGTNTPGKELYYKINELIDFISKSIETNKYKINKDIKSIVYETIYFITDNHHLAYIY